MRNPGKRASRWLRTNRSWLAAVLVSVVVAVFSSPPYRLGLLMLAGLAPVFWAVEKAPNWRAAAFRGWVFSFFYSAVVCSWVANSVHEFTRLPWVLSYPSVVLLAIFEQGSWPALLALRHVVQRRFGLRPVLWTPAALLFIDVCWPRFFPSSLGNVFYSVPWLAQASDLFGVGGLAALLAMTNELLGVALARTWPRSELIKHACVAVGVLAFFCGYGAWRLGQVHKLMEHPNGSLRVALVQPNVNGVLKVRAEVDKDMAREELLRFMLELTNHALPSRPDFIFWPETAFADTYHGESENESVEVTAALDQYLRTNKIPLLFGARDQVGHERFNALFLAGADGSGKILRQPYHKTHLLPLAEHVPLSEYVAGLPQLIREYGGTDYAYGSGPTLFDGPKELKLGALICLEGLYARYARELVNKGADVLVNATNDGWFGAGMEPELHLSLTAFRSIETRRPLIRATNTGYSAVIDIDGSYKFKSGLFERDVASVDVPTYSPIATPFLWLGDWPVILCGLYGFGVPLIGLIRRRFKVAC